MIRLPDAYYTGNLDERKFPIFPPGMNGHTSTPWSDVSAMCVARPSTRDLYAGKYSLFGFSTRGNYVLSSFDSRIFSLDHVTYYDFSSERTAM